MKLSHPKCDWYVQDGTEDEIAIRRVTHLGIVSHQDDFKIAAYRGIPECFHQKDRWFSGVVVCNGVGSSRKGDYADYTDEPMRGVRRGQDARLTVRILSKLVILPPLAPLSPPYTPSPHHLLAQLDPAPSKAIS